MPSQIINITNEEAFMADNMQYIRLPSEDLLFYLN